MLTRQTNMDNTDNMDKTDKHGQLKHDKHTVLLKN